MKLILLLIGVALLTILTQVGGVVLLVSWLLVRLADARRSLARSRTVFALGAFIVVYALTSVLVVPSLARTTGRVPLPCDLLSDAPLRPASFLTCLLNRHYAEPRIVDVADRLASEIAERYPGTVTLYLDANFPFLDGFPLFPHLSHSDGRKLDIAFYYRDGDGVYLPGETRFPIGYWAFEQPGRNARPLCDGASWFSMHWEMAILQPLFPRLTLDAERTRFALNWLTTSGREEGISRIFLEPLLVDSMGVNSPLIRFQGCRVARHDDHIHLEIQG